LDDCLSLSGATQEAFAAVPAIAGALGPRLKYLD
jgi:hypothetical protein